MGVIPAGPRADAVLAGKYRLLRRLGGGGTGDVYRAEHVSVGRTVAIKLLRAELAADEDLARLFLVRAQIARRIRHPSMVDVLDAGSGEHGPYLVMEYLEGTTLADALERLGRLDPGRALAVLLPVLDALDAAHREGVAHGDLKPANVFLAVPCTGERCVKVKLLDVASALLERAPDCVSADAGAGEAIFGTADYLSPEQASGDAPVDARSDVFSAGVVLFELVTGRRPFAAPTAVAAAYKVVHEPAPRVADFGVSVDPALQTALDVALAKSPTERYPTAGAFAAALGPLAPGAAARAERLRDLVPR